jgi:hypothetical protein
MKLIIFKKTTLNSQNIEDFEKPKKVTQFSILGIKVYRSEDFQTESNSDII